MVTAVLFRQQAVREFEEALSESLIRSKKAIAGEVLRRIVDRTPVKSGRARANNIVSTGSRDLQVFPDNFDIGGQATITSGLAIIAAINDPFSPVYIQNNLEYAGELENGSSSQAPLGFYAITLEEIRSEFGGP